MSEPVEYLDLDDLIQLTVRLLASPPPVRDIGLLESAAARPRTSVFGEDAYPDVWTKAAALLQSIVKNHALVDGNKRLAWVATATFLEINGVGVTEVLNDDVYDFAIAAATSDLEVGQLARRLRELVDE